MCIGCRRVAPAGELVRCAATDDGRLVISRSAPGRGAWLCPSVDCIGAATRRRSFERALRRSISTDAVSELRIAFEALLGNMRELPAAGPGSAAARTKKG